MLQLRTKLVTWFESAEKTRKPTQTNHIIYTLNGSFPWFWIQSKEKTILSRSFVLNRFQSMDSFTITWKNINSSIEMKLAMWNIFSAIFSINRWKNKWLLCVTVTLKRHFKLLDIFQQYISLPSSFHIKYLSCVFSFLVWSLSIPLSSWARSCSTAHTHKIKKNPNNHLNKQHFVTLRTLTSMRESFLNWLAIAMNIFSKSFTQSNQNYEIITSLIKWHFCMIQNISGFTHSFSRIASCQRKYLSREKERKKEHISFIDLSIYY